MGVFNGIIGHERATGFLARALDNGQLAHAYLFIGPDGVGKTVVAQALIRAAVGDWTHPDVTVVSRLVDEKTEKLATVISVDQIREVRERLSLTALGGGRKAVFIEEADRLNPAAANAFLKTLEEPRGDTLVILRASRVESVPATIASRCQVLRFPIVPRDVITKALVARGLDRAEASQLAALSDGRPGVALRLVKDGAFRAQMETSAGLVFALVGRSIPARLKAVAELLPKDEANKAVVLEQQLDGWERILRDQYLAAVGCPELAVHTVSKLSLGTCVAALKAVAEARRAATHNVNPQLALEHVALSF